MSNIESLDEKFSKYGEYFIENNPISLILPNNEILIDKISDSHLKYIIKNSNGNKVEKNILLDSKTIQIELCPVFPIHLPKQKTNDFVFLKIKNGCQIGANSSIELQFQFPIELGVFLKRQNKMEKIDILTCEKTHSKFALYGTPQNGTLCKFAIVNLTNTNKPAPYVYSNILISIQNELSEEITLDKIVFPVTSLRMYYDDSSAYVDGINARIYQAHGKQLVEITQKELLEKQDGLKVSPSGNKGNDKKLFVMDRGF